MNLLLPGKLMEVSDDVISKIRHGIDAIVCDNDLLLGALVSKFCNVTGCRLGQRYPVGADCAVVLTTFRLSNLMDLNMIQRDNTIVHLLVLDAEIEHPLMEKIYNG